jgi:DNA-binding IclR family transcriptional regulator
MKNWRPPHQALLLALLNQPTPTAKSDLKKISHLPKSLFALHLETLCSAGAVTCDSEACRLTVPTKFMVPRGEIKN